MPTPTMPLDLTALAVEIMTGQPAELTADAEPAATLASLTADHQALSARCIALMEAYTTAQNTAQQAYDQHTLLSAQADEAWQLHREQSFVARQLHEQWRAALRERQHIFEELRNLEDLL